MEHHTLTSYAIQVKHIFHTSNGVDTPYTETLAMCTNYKEAQEIASSYKKAFIVEIEHSRTK